MFEIIHDKDLSPMWHTIGPNLRINEMMMSQSAMAPGIIATMILREAPARVIEIGTSAGGFASMLSYVCQSVGTQFTTMDIRPSLDYKLAPCGRFLTWDCFAHIDEIGAWIASPGLTILLCDGGNKPLEFNTFSKFLKPGDIIGAHDYMADATHIRPDGTEHRIDPNIGWGFCETSLCNLELEGLSSFQPYWTELCGWTIWQKD